MRGRYRSSRGKLRVDAGSGNLSTLLASNLRCHAIRVPAPTVGVSNGCRNRGKNVSVEIENERGRGFALQVSDGNLWLHGNDKQGDTVVVCLGEARQAFSTFARAAAEWELPRMLAQLPRNGH